MGKYLHKYLNYADFHADYEGEKPLRPDWFICSLGKFFYSYSPNDYWCYYYDGNIQLSVFGFAPKVGIWTGATLPDNPDDFVGAINYNVPEGQSGHYVEITEVAPVPEPRQSIYSEPWVSVTKGKYISGDTRWGDGRFKYEYIGEVDVYEGRQA